MSKHNLVGGALPPAKRLHREDMSVEKEGFLDPQLSLDNALSDELILSIFAHLSHVDLCQTSATNRSWCRLSADNELWKALYLKTFGRTRLRGARGFIGRTDGREVKPLPGRAKLDEAYKDWKWMFRISWNWKTGRCKLDQLDNIGSSTRSSSDPKDETYHSHLILAGTLAVVASPLPSLSPTVHIRSEQTHHSLVCKSTLAVPSLRITSLALDQSPPSEPNRVSRLAAFLSTGEFSIFSVDHTHPAASSCKMTYVPARRGTRTSPIIQAVYHHPLLITLSQVFSLSIYDLSDPDAVVHTQTLSSFTSFPPTSLVLSTPSPTTYKLVMAYAIPVYPSHWTVGATELVISGPTSSSPPSTMLPSSQATLASAFTLPSTPMSVVSSRTTRAMDIPPGWIDETKLRQVREQWGRKVARVADTQTDGKWLILAPGESTSSSSSIRTNASTSLTTLQLYRISLPSGNSSAPKLVFVRNLYGQTGRITALSLSDGRCVSLSENGCIWVWDLEAGDQAEVAPSKLIPESDCIGKGSIVFDDRKIVSARTGTSPVEIRRFDA